jgi:hypothetical protein
MTTDVGCCFNITENVEVIFAKFKLSFGSTMVDYGNEIY